MSPLKLASGCDRRCAFCAIPSFRGSFVSRPPHDVLSEAAWLAGQGVREVVLVSENSTSYGKDLPGGTRALVGLLPARQAHALSRVEPWGFFIVLGLVLLGVVGTYWLRPLISRGYTSIDFLLTPLTALLR